MSSYVVLPGDTLYRIARRHGLTPDALAEANRLDDPSRLRPGQILIIPGALPAPPAIDRENLRLPTGKYFPREFPKDLIVLHFTAGSSARSAFDAWTSTPGEVATPYIVDLDGTIYETFDPRYWAYHLGVVGASSENHLHDRRSIPIEIVNIGALKPDPADPSRLNAWPPSDPLTSQATFRTHWCNINEAAHYVKLPFRGFQYFAAFPAPQVASVVSLVRYLTSRFGIPLRLPPPGLRPAFNLDFFRSWQGIASHQNFRADKTDIGPAFDWDKLHS